MITYSFLKFNTDLHHYNDVIMSAMASQITSLMIVYSTVYSGADEKRHQNSASLAFVRGIHRWPVNSPHKGPVTREMFPFDDVIMLITWQKNVPCDSLFGKQNSPHTTDDIFKRILWVKMFICWSRLHTNVEVSMQCSYNECSWYIFVLETTFPILWYCLR